MAVTIAVLVARPSEGQRPDSSRVDSTSRRGPASLAPVVVSGTPLTIGTDRRLPVRTDVFDGHATAPGPASLADALATLPGVSVSNDQGSRAQPTLQLRGFTLSPVAGVPQGISVFLDGVRINEPDAQELFFDLIPFDAVERAEVMRGPSALHGKNSLGGALNLVTRRGGETPTVETAIAAGSFGTLESRVTASGKLGDYDGYLMLRSSRESGYQAQSGSDVRQLLSTVGRRDSSSDVDLSLLIAGSRVFEAGSLPESWLRTDRRANYTGGDFSHPGLTQLSLHGMKSGHQLELRGNLFARRNMIEQFNVNVSDPDSRAFVTNSSLGGSGELATSVQLLGRPLALTVGAEYAHTDVSYRLFAEASAANPALPADCDAAGLCEDARVPGDDAALYLQALLEVHDRLTLLLSARGDRVRIPFHDLRDAGNDGTNIFRQISPKVGLTFAPSATVRAYASVGLGFRAPAALELACASPTAACPLPFSLGADPPLRPVLAWNREMGADWSATGGAAVAVALFRTEVTDEIMFVTSHSAAGYFENVPHTRRDGVEASFNLPLPHAARVRAAYSYVDASYRSATTIASALDDNDVQVGDAFPMSPLHRGSLEIGAVHALGSFAVDATLAMRAVSSQYLRGDEANHRAPIPGYAVADFHVQVERGRATMDLSATNVLNRRYVLYGVYAQNPKGALDGAPLGRSTIEPFFTPAYPRVLSAGVALRW